VVSLRRGAAGELGPVPVDERIGELPLHAHELEPVRLELAAADAAVAHRLALRDERADCLLEGTKMVERIHCAGGLDVRLEVIGRARLLDGHGLGLLLCHGRKMRYAVPGGHPEEMRRSSW
jgi:hypothetical protein